MALSGAEGFDHFCQSGCEPRSHEGSLHVGQLRTALIFSNLATEVFMKGCITTVLVEVASFHLRSKLEAGSRVCEEFASGNDAQFGDLGVVAVRRSV